MARWNNGVNKITSFTEEGKNSLEDYFTSKNFQPKNEQEEQIFNEFSLVTSTMAILIHVAESDSEINKHEKDQIINDIIFQLEQRPYEVSKLSEKFGSDEKEIIHNMYNKLLADYNADKINLPKIVNDICVYYQKNPEKRYYLIRLSYYCALSDHILSDAEKKTIREIAEKMQVPSVELERIEKEVRQEIASKNKH